MLLELDQFLYFQVYEIRVTNSTTTRVEKDKLMNLDKKLQRRNRVDVILCSSGFQMTLVSHFADNRPGQSLPVCDRFLPFAERRATELRAV